MSPPDVPARPCLPKAGYGLSIVNVDDWWDKAAIDSCGEASVPVMMVVMAMVKVVIVVMIMKVVEH